MDVDEFPRKTALALHGAQSSVSISLHPLVLMNISEHWTRSRAQNHGVRIAVFGALLGKQRGRSLQLMNSFEVPVTTVEGKLVVDCEFFRVREEQYREVFTELDLLGWYTTGDEEPTLEDAQVHQQMCELSESLVLLKMNPDMKVGDKLPVEVYESTPDITVRDNDSSVQFIMLPWTLATEEAERIGVDHVARISVANVGSESAATKQLLSHHGAVKMLHNRLKLIIDYLKNVESGSLPRNEHILRDVATLCWKLPLMDSDRFQNQLTNQCNDIKLTAFLSSLTKSCGSINQLINKLNVVSERHGGGGIRRSRAPYM